jgi:hypothetical protein
MSGWLVDLLILLGILGVVVVAAWFVLQQIALPEPIQKILIIVLVILAAVIAVAILLSLRGGVKLGGAPDPFRVTVAALAPISTASAADTQHRRPGAKRLVLEPVAVEVCERIRQAVRVYGVATVEAGAAAQGYTRAQIAQARAYCL